MDPVFNSHFKPEPSLARPEYQWFGGLRLWSDSQDLGVMAPDVLASSLTMTDMPKDIRTIFAGQLGRTGILEMSTTLEASNKSLAMLKMAGLALLATRKAGVQIEKMHVLAAASFLVSIAELNADSGNNVANVLNGVYKLDKGSRDVFEDMRARMIRYGLPATY